MRSFYTSRLSQNPRVRGALTVRLHFPPGDKRPEVYVQKDEPRDANLTTCLSEALRSKDLFPWRPSQVADLGALLPLLALNDLPGMLRAGQREGPQGILIPRASPEET